MEYVCDILVVVLTIVFEGECCQHTYTSNSSKVGTFNSPGYPRPYPSNSQCQYDFLGTSDERIKISFVDLDLQVGEASGCLYDYVDIFAIDEDEINFKERLCGNSTYKPFISVHKHVQVIFKSDDTYPDSNKGFNATYEFVHESWQPFLPSPAICGPSLVTGVGGELTSPLYPSPYPINVECFWVIRVEPQKRILITFIDIDMGQSTKCVEANLSVYNGFASLNDHPAKTHCGQLFFLKNGYAEDFISRGYRVVVRFKSIGNFHKCSGFRLAWTALNLPKLTVDEEGREVAEPCSGYHCKGEEYCDGTSGVLCNALPRYCISETLVCDDIPHCGHHNQSDEHYCWASTVAIALVVIVPILAIGIIAFLVVRYRQRKAWQKQLAKGKNLAGGHLEQRNSIPSPSLSYNSIIESQIKFFSSPEFRRSSDPMSTVYKGSSFHRRGSRRGSGRHGYLPCEPPASENYYAPVCKPAVLVTTTTRGTPTPSPKKHKRVTPTVSFGDQSERYSGEWEDDGGEATGTPPVEPCYANLTPVRRQGSVKRVNVEPQESGSVAESPYYQTVEEARQNARQIHTVIV